MQWLLIAIGVIYAVGWVIVKIFEGISGIFASIAEQKKQKELEAIKEQERITRELKRKEEEQKNAKRDELLSFVEVYIPDELNSTVKKISKTQDEFNQKLETKLKVEIPHWEEKAYVAYRNANKKNTGGQMYVDDVDKILTPNEFSWIDIEKELLSTQCKYPSKFQPRTVSSYVEFPQLLVQLKEAKFEYDDAQISNDDLKTFFSKEKRAVDDYNKRRIELLETVKQLNKEILDYNQRAKIDFEIYKKESETVEKRELEKFEKFSRDYLGACKEQKDFFKKLLDGFNSSQKEEVIQRMNFVLGSIKLPSSIPHTWDVDFDAEEKIAIVEVGLPDVVHNPPVKRVKLKSGIVDKPLNQSEKKEIIPNIHPAILLRIAYEIFKSDSSETLKLLVLNGWIKFDDPKTGIDTKAYTVSLMVEKSQIEKINLKKLDPLVAFINLKGKTAGKLVEIIPVTPVMSLDRKDKRFIATSEVLNKLGSETNLASMDWQDFESLIAELFEKEFAQEGAEVKVTQASRDRGVDAVIFDPDPIRGGKIIVQAKRYANTVDVSAVRDLCAVVKKEGAIKGILVTTSTYGGDAYQFANNEPVTLLNGAELLGLLKKHGYTFRINLEEAKKLNLANSNYKK